MDNEGEHVVEMVQAVNWSCLFDSFHHSPRLSVRRYDGELLAAIASEPHTISESVNRELTKSQHESGGKQQTVGYPCIRAPHATDVP